MVTSYNFTKLIFANDDDRVDITGFYGQADKRIDLYCDYGG